MSHLFMIFWFSWKTKVSRLRRVFWGMDSRGREILSFLEGETWRTVALGSLMIC